MLSRVSHFLNKAKTKSGHQKDENQEKDEGPVAQSACPNSATGAAGSACAECHYNSSFMCRLIIKMFRELFFIIMERPWSISATLENACRL